jgi:hypothetical protein
MNGRTPEPGARAEVVEMDAAIAELREKVAAPEKAYAAVKKRQGKTKP